MVKLVIFDIFLLQQKKTLTRVQSLVDHVREWSKDLYQPNREVAGDERMVASKQVLRNTPIYQR